MNPFLFIFTILALLSPPAWAHKASDSYLSLRVDASHIEGQWDIALRDLDDAIGLDRDDDGAITWGETSARHAAIAAYALSRLSLTIGGAACATAATEHLIDHHTDGAYAVLRFTAACPSENAPLAVDYRLLFDLDAQHKGLLRLTRDDKTQTAIFSQDSTAHAFSFTDPPIWPQMRQYLHEGIWHIWKGFDHVLFLLTLLLPAVLSPVDHGWQPVERLSPAIREVTIIVTAFTIAHSLTLSLAALDILRLPSRLVESTIALSVFLAGIANLYPAIITRRWLVAFAFGLIHGFGFAGVLSDLGLPQSALLLSLTSFNAGVEIGQLVIVALFLPLAYRARQSSSYQPVVVRAGSIAVMIVALLWLAERALNLTLFPA